MRYLLTIILTLASLPAYSAQFDAILHYSSAAAAQADLADHYASTSLTPGWLSDHVVVVQAWRNSLDTTSIQNNPDGTQSNVTTHTFLAGFFVLVSADHLILALRDNPALQVAFNRDKCNAGLVGCVIESNVSAALLQDIRVSPVFAGSNYPFGGLQ